MCLKICSGLLGTGCHGGDGSLLVWGRRWTWGGTNDWEMFLARSDGWSCSCDIYLYCHRGSHGVLSLFGPGIQRERPCPKQPMHEQQWGGVVLGMTAKPGSDPTLQSIVGQVQPLWPPRVTGLWQEDVPAQPLHSCTRESRGHPWGLHWVIVQLFWWLKDEMKQNLKHLRGSGSSCG